MWTEQDLCLSSSKSLLFPVVPLLPGIPTCPHSPVCVSGWMAHEDPQAQLREMDYAHTQDVKQLNGRMSAAGRKGRDVRDRAPRAPLFYY